MQRCPRAPIASSVTELYVGYLRRGKRMGAAMLLAHRIEAKPKMPRGLNTPEMHVLPIILERWGAAVGWSDLHSGGPYRSRWD